MNINDALGCNKTLIFFVFCLLFSSLAFAVPLQPDAVSVYVSNVTLGDIWVLQLVAHHK
jgi:hypothetical protein